MSEKKAKEKRAKQVKAVNPQQPTIPIGQALQMQSAKVGMLNLQIDIMSQRMIKLQEENNRLKAQLTKYKAKGK